MYAGEDALADRIRRIGMCQLAPLAGSALLTGQEDPYIDPAIISKIPTGDISGAIPEGEVVEVEVEGEVDEVDVEEDDLLHEYLEQCKELVRSRWSVVEALAQRLLSQRSRSLKAVEIAEVLEASDG